MREHAPDGAGANDRVHGDEPDTMPRLKEDPFMRMQRQAQAALGYIAFWADAIDDRAPDVTPLQYEIALTLSQCIRVLGTANWEFRKLHGGPEYSPAIGAIMEALRHLETLAKGVALNSERERRDYR